MKNTKTSLLLSLCLFTVYFTKSVSRFGYDERPDAYQTRTSCAYNQNFNVADYDIENENNQDQFNVADFAAMFTKTFPHDPTTSAPNATGQKSFQTLVDATKNGSQATYDNIVRASGASKLTNPQASSAWSLIGRDSSLNPMLTPPTLGSPEAACDLAEVYLMAICRNVSFADYGTGTGTDIDLIHGGSITNNACAVLNAFGSAYVGPTASGSVTPAVLFRGTADGCLKGPYISQFLLQDLHRINQPLAVIQQLVPIASNREFGVTWSNFIAIEDGAIPVPYDPSDFSGLRYTINGRDLGTSVHKDFATDFGLQAYNILFNNGFPQAPNLPYFDGTTPNEAAFATFGPQDVVASMSIATRIGLQHAWAHKWRATRRLRPEAMAGLAYQVVVTSQNPYGLNTMLFGTLGDINLMDWVTAYNSTQLPFNPDNATSLLAQMFPDGSPTHPSYPSGHSVFVSAAVTMLKAFVDDTALLKDYSTPTVPNPTDPTQLIPLTDGSELLLTVGGELDKLASNIALGRNFAGVHYRWDGDQGVLLGETVAIQVLMDIAASYTEETFTGFQLTKRNGTRINITASGITVIS